MFNDGRKEVQSFVLSSALFWLDRHHADDLCLDAVAAHGHSQSIVATLPPLGMLVLKGGPA